MKVRVKGLVFAGFAAAIFAQSAMADNNADAKTVTSKLYVDQKVETTTGTGTPNDPYVSTITANNANADTKAPSIRNVYEFVTNAVGSLSVSGDKYIDASTTDGETSISLTTANLAGDAASIFATTVATDTAPAAQEKLVKAAAVNDLVLKETTAGTTTITQAYAENLDGRGENHVPTVRNVYDYAQQKVLNNSNLYVGSKGAWGQLSSATSNGATSNDYVTIKETSANSGVYKVNIAADSIASDSAAITTGGTINTGTEAEQNAAKGKLATAKAVYDFVSTYGGNTYQPKVGGAGSVDSTSGKSKVMVGYSTRTGTSGSYEYSSTWQPLAGDDYVTVGLDASDNPKVGLTNLTTGAANFVATGTTNAASYRPMLAKAGDVYDFVIGQTGGNLIPQPGEDCSLGANGITDSNNHACALVLAYWAAGESPTGQAGVGLKWVPMPQP